MVRAAAAVFSGLLLVGCLSPPPSQRVTEVAREMNTAARFGRMDLALEHTAAGARDHFAKHRAAWGNEVRVLDFELSNLTMKDSEHAIVVIDIQWMLLAEDMLRMTKVEQTWHGGSIGDKGWSLTRERRVGGDIGLFGEKVAKREADTPRDDIQFPSKTIR
jgi:hypothetical protein